MGSFLDDLRDLDRHVRAHATKSLVVTGSGGHIAVRYRPPDRSQLGALITAFNTGEALTKDEELQLIVDCCDEIVQHDPGTGIETSYDDGPLCFDASDPRWGDGVKTARDCVARLFKIDLQPLAAAGHIGTLVPWLNGLEAEASARVEGKSEAPAT